MTTKHKITMFSTLCFVALSSMYFLNTEDEVTPISEKTEKKIIIEKKPLPKEKVEEKVIIKQEEPKKIAPIVQKKETKKVSDNNNSKNSVTFEIVSKDEVTDEMISDLSEDISPRGSSIQDYIEKYDDYRYFKTDLTPIFNAKVGETVSINISGKIYKGVLTDSETKLPDKEVFGEYYEDTTFSYYIQMEKRYAHIRIDGRINPDGHYYYRGEIIDLVSTDLDLEFFINNDMGIVMSEIQYASQYDDPNIQYEY